MPLRSHPIVGDAEVMPNLPEGTLPLEAQTHTQGTPTHCCGGVGDVLGGKGHEVGGLGHASLCCAPLQNETGLGITGQQQDKVSEPIEGVGESIQSGDVRVPEGTSWGSKGDGAVLGRGRRANAGVISRRRAAPELCWLSSPHWHTAKRG